MSTRPQIKPQIVIPSAQASPASSGAMTGNITSAPTIISNVSMVNYSASWTGSSPVGTFDLFRPQMTSLLTPTAQSKTQALGTR